DPEKFAKFKILSSESTVADNRLFDSIEQGMPDQDVLALSKVNAEAQKALYEFAGYQAEIVRLPAIRDSALVPERYALEMRSSPNLAVKSVNRTLAEFAPGVRYDPVHLQKVGGIGGFSSGMN